MTESSGERSTITRTRYSFYNFIVSTITAVILPLVGVIKVRLFIDFYGSGLNGLQLTIAQVITFLNICELAYSLAFRQLLFKPLAENNREEVLRIYNGAVRIFRRTGMVVLAAGLLIAFVFPFFAESPLDYWLTVGTFVMLMLPYGISYFLMGPNFVIMADQKEYKISIFIQSISILRMFLMVLIIRMKMSFFWILVIEGLNILIANFTARRIALREYPWLKDAAQYEPDSAFGGKAKYAIIQRLSELATTQTDNIVISAFMGYSMTSVFGSYSYLTDNISKITQTMVQSPMNSFGNLFNDERADKYEVFTEFFNFATYVSTIVAVCIFIAMPQFIHIWLNKPEYEVTVPICLAFALNIFYMTMRQPVIIARDANGLYVNAKNNAYLLAASKVVLSVLLIQKLGLLGVILATLLTSWTVDFLYNPRLVYSHVFRLPSWRYYAMVASRLGIALVLGGIGYLIWNQNLAYITSSTMHLVTSILVMGVIVVIITTAIYAAAYRSFRRLFSRIRSILSRRSANKK